MTRLERRIAELAAALFTPASPGATIHVGTYTYKPGEWFAACSMAGGKNVEGYGSSAESALDALIAQLRTDADRAEREASAAAERARRLNGIGAS